MKMAAIEIARGSGHGARGNRQTRIPRQNGATTGPDGHPSRAPGPERLKTEGSRRVEGPPAPDWTEIEAETAEIETTATETDATEIADTEMTMSGSAPPMTS